MNVNVDGAGDDASANDIDDVESTLRQNEPTARWPSGTETNTTPVPRVAIRNAPAASVTTTVSWFETATSAMPGSPESRTPFSLRSRKTAPLMPASAGGLRTLGAPRTNTYATVFGALNEAGGI